MLGRLRLESDTRERVRFCGAEATRGLKGWLYKLTMNTLEAMVSCADQGVRFRAGLGRRYRPYQMMEQSFSGREIIGSESLLGVVQKEADPTAEPLSTALLLIIFPRGSYRSRCIADLGIPRSR
jgi:hypothetical protein